MKEKPTSPKQNPFRKTFITGLLTISPVLLTAFLLLWIFELFTANGPKVIHFVVSQIHPKWGTAIENQYIIHQQFISLVIIVVMIYCVGLFVRNILGRKTFDYLEKLILHIPIVKTIYSTLRQLSFSLFNSQEKMFSKVVMVQYPSEISYVIGFQTKDAPEGCNSKCGEQLVSVFIPTTPNPTSGFLVFYPKSKVQVLDMSITDGMRLIISAGVVHPGDDEEKDLFSHTQDGENEVLEKQP